MCVSHRATEEDEEDLRVASSLTGIRTGCLLNNGLECSVTPFSVAVFFFVSDVAANEM